LKLDIESLRLFSQRYLEILTMEFAGLNLTRILESEEFFYKQILDSLIPLEKSLIFENEIREKGLLVDVGFGGGFPLLPLAFLLPEVKFLGFEARKKKATAVQRIAELLNLSNVKTYHQRVEEVDFDRPSVVTYKAVGPIEPTLARQIQSSKETTVAFYKGPKTDELEKVDGYKNWNLAERFSYDITHHGERDFLIFKNVPHGTDKRVVKLTAIS